MMSTETDEMDFVETILVPDLACIPLEQIHVEGKPGIKFVEKPSYIVHELITIKDDPVSETDREDDLKDNANRTTGGFASQQNQSGSAERSRGTKGKAQVQTWTSPSTESVVIKIILKKD